MKKIHKYIRIGLSLLLWSVVLFFAITYAYIEFKNRQIERHFLDRFEILQENGIDISDKFIAVSGSGAYCLFYYKLVGPDTKNLGYMKMIVSDGYIVYSPRHNPDCDFYDWKYKGEDIFRHKSL